MQFLIFISFSVLNQFNFTKKVLLKKRKYDLYPRHANHLLGNLIFLYFRIREKIWSMVLLFKIITSLCMLLLLGRLCISVTLTLCHIVTMLSNMFVTFFVPGNINRMDVCHFQTKVIAPFVV